MEPNNVLALLGLIATVVFQTWGVIRWVTGRMDNNHTTTREELTKLNGRINEVKDTYVKRSDLDRELQNIYSSLSEIKNDYRNQSSEINSRFDALIMALNSKD